MASKQDLEALGIESNNIIICEKCYEENEATRNTCKKCGAKLYHNDNNNQSKKYKENTEEDEEFYNSLSDSSTNTVAKVVKIIAILEAIASVILGLITIDDLEVYAVTIIVAGIISAIFVYALGEIIQLLEDIKNK